MQAGTKRVGVVAALRDEARTFPAGEPTLADGAVLVVKVTGPGNAGAAAGANALIEAGCSGLLSWGVAGGLDPALEPGELLVADAVTDADGVLLPVDGRFVERLTRALGGETRIAAVHSAAQPVTESAAKARLRQRFGAAAVDMESAAVARLARDAALPFACVRCIVDPARFSLPEAVSGALGPDGTVRSSTLAMGLLRRPGQLPDLLRLARWYRAALARLARAARDLTS